MIRIVLVDDDVLVRSGLRVILGSEPGINVVGEAGTGREALDVAARLEPDVVLMDVRMPDLDGIEATASLTARDAHRPRVLVLTTFDDDDYLYRALRAGASGFTLKRATPEELVHAIHVIASGNSLVLPDLTRRLIARHHAPAPDHAQALSTLSELTAREADVLRLVAGGLSNSEIAQRLVLSRETVKTHVGNVLLKLGARDRTQAVIAAYDSGFLRADPD